VAISLSGNPVIIILDEPTTYFPNLQTSPLLPLVDFHGCDLVFLLILVASDTICSGLDPLSKRKLWNVLSSCKAGRCMILTTHSMVLSLACSSIQKKKKQKIRGYMSTVYS
jgi:ABC-type multidrug transport system ATPase subunit